MVEQDAVSIEKDPTLAGTSVARRRGPCKTQSTWSAVLRKVVPISPLDEDVTEEASAKENKVDIRDYFDQEIRRPTVQTVDIFHGIPDAMSSV